MEVFALLPDSTELPVTIGPQDAGPDFLKEVAAGWGCDVAKISLSDDVDVKSVVGGDVVRVEWSPKELAVQELKDLGLKPIGWQLRRAVIAGRLSVVVLLLRAGVSPSYADDTGNTPLHIAAGRNDTEMIQHLLEASANPTAVNTFGSTPLHSAAGSFSPDAAKLLATVVPLNIPNNFNNTPLDNARSHSQEAYDFMLSLGCDPALSSRE